MLKKMIVLGSLLALASPLSASVEQPLSFYHKSLSQDVENLQLDKLDIAKLMVEDELAKLRGEPYRYAVTRNQFDAQGTWKTHGDHSIWQLNVNAEGATSLSFGFDNVFLPEGAELFVYDAKGNEVLGPFTSQDNNASKQLWTPMLEVDSATIEVNVPNEFKKQLQFQLKHINQGYRGIKAGDLQKSGSCNIDVVCSDGDGWRDEIRSVARYTFTKDGSSFLCTGSMVNNTAEDFKPYFLTANHCVSTAAEVSSMVIYWNYETSACGGTPNGSLSQSQSGASLRATWEPADVTLVELNAMPNEDYNVYFAGWDNSAPAPSASVTIHHPAGDEKRISFDDNPATITNYLSDVVNSNANYLRIGEWERGTTEGGSSGSGLWNLNKHIVGVLSGGNASCQNQDAADWYGRIATQWDGGGTAASQLKAWLDPTNSGVSSLDGSDVKTCPNVNVTFSIDPRSPQVGQEVNFAANVSGGNDTDYAYAWDFDGDGTTDSTEASPTYTYTSTYVGNVSLNVSDSTNCPGAASAPITVEPDGGNTAPVASVSQASLNVDENTSFTLDASASSDADNDALTYQWAQISGATATISGASTATAQVTSPSVGTAGDTLEFEVTVTDAFGAQDTATVSVTVNNVNAAPVASVSSASITVDEGATVNLNASNSSDADGDTLTYAWTQISGTSVSLSDTNSSTTSFVAPEVNSRSTYVFEVTVTDPAGLSDSTRVTVNVNDVPPPSSGGGGGSMNLLFLMMLLFFMQAKRRKQVMIKGIK